MDAKVTEFQKTFKVPGYLSDEAVRKVIEGLFSRQHVASAGYVTGVSTQTEDEPPKISISIQGRECTLTGSTQHQALIEDVAFRFVCEHPY